MNGQINSKVVNLEFSEDVVIKALFCCECPQGLHFRFPLHFFILGIFIPRCEVVDTSFLSSMSGVSQHRGSAR